MKGETMRNQWFTLAILLMVPITSQLFAQKPGGFYLGAGIGSSFVNTEVTDLDGDKLKIDENDFAYKFFGGLKLGRLWGIEGGYRNLGKAQTDISGVSVETKTKGWDVYGMGKITLVMVDVFAKGGAFFWKVDNKIGAESSDESGTDFAWGFGAGLNLGSLGVRAEWERFSVEDLDNLSMLSLSLTLGF